MWFKPLLLCFSRVLLLNFLPFSLSFFVTAFSRHSLFFPFETNSLLIFLLIFVDLVYNWAECNSIRYLHSPLLAAVNSLKNLHGFNYVWWVGKLVSFFHHFPTTLLQSWLGFHAIAPKLIQQANVTSDRALCRKMDQISGKFFIIMVIIIIIITMIITITIICFRGTI